MPILNGDTILIQRGGTSYKVNAIDYADIALDTDLILVNRGGSSYKMAYSAVDDANDTDLVLVNRSGSSYKATMEQLRDVLGQPITFTIDLRGEGESGQSTSGCWDSGTTYSRYGAKLTATITAKTTDVYAFSGATSNNRPTTTSLYLNGDWIATAGHAGNFGVNYYRNIGCNQIKPGTGGQGMSALGVNQLEGQKVNNYIDYGANFAVLQGGGGAGCPGGTTGGSSDGGTGGFCQTRPRAENTGSDTWNEITVANAVATASGATSLTASRSITYNGVTRTFTTASTGKLKELLDW